MITGSEGACRSVVDQDAALAFYVNKLSVETRGDMQAGVCRWVTVSPPGAQGLERTLYRPGRQDGEVQARQWLS